MNIDSSGFFSKSSATKYTSLIATGFLLFVGGCQEDPPGELMPLAVGNYWAYERSRYYDGQVSEGLTDSVKAEIVAETTVTYAEQAYKVALSNGFYAVPSVPSHVNWLLWNGEDGLYLLGGMSSNDTLVHKILHAKYPVQQGDSWQVSWLYYIWEPGNFVIEDTETITCIAINKKFETPAGTFRCYVYQFRRQTVDDVAAKSDFYEYYAPGVGLVGQEIKNEGILTFRYVLYDYHLN